MTRRALLLAVSLIACSSADSSSPAGSAADAGTTLGSGSSSGSIGDASTGDSSTPAGGKLVWIGAHPDDELYVAPWLGEQCVDKKLACTLLVMTRGEAGKCKLAGGCAPDLATLRDAELEASAKRIGATLVHWDLGDGTAADPTSVAKNWDAKKGGTLVADVAKIIEGATVIASFDPRHGDSCHADHRAAGAVAILARRSLGTSAPYVTMVASKGIIAKAAPDDASVVAYDATAHWFHLVDTLKTHASQFTADEVAAVEATPNEQRKTFLLSEENAKENDPAYAGVCP